MTARLSARSLIDEGSLRAIRSSWSSHRLEPRRAWATWPGGDFPDAAGLDVVAE